MQSSLGSFRDRVSRLGWEAASDRPMAWRAPWRHLDPMLVLATLGLTILGCAAVYSSTFAELRGQGLPGDHLLRRQLFSLAAGLVGLVLATLFDYRRLQAWAAALLGVTALLLILVLTPLGSAANGSQSWFAVGSAQLQPSEWAKVAVVIALAAILAAGPPRPGLRQLGLALGAVALVGAEILLQPDFGTFIVFAAILFGALLLGGVPARWLLVLVLCGGVGVVGMFKLDVLKDYQKQRLTAFINPDADVGGRGFSWNYRQSLIAVGSGGLTGKGYLRGPQTNLNYVPEQHTDFIFTVIAEELGFAGAGLLLALYAVLLWRGLRIAALARDRFGTLLAGGVVSMLGFQAFVNVGMTLGIMPITGIPLPFVSYGGSSMIASFVAVGVVLNVHMRRFL
ncbi:MAG TPA: rod shape-determining protein RodA [Actinomycetes bacterium]|nr:rod shape-determining protein RodA [Actinomycetes bacterium]